MTAPTLALADELAAIRAEIARLKSRESALASIQHSFPKVPLFRRSAGHHGDAVQAGMTAAHA